MRILVVDDEPLARRRLAAMVDDLELGATVFKAENGEQALAVAAEERPDIVLLDIRMPRMDGVEAARHLARLDPPPAVIFTTAYDQHALAAFDANAVDYLLKPVKRERLDAAIEKARTLRRGQAEALGGDFTGGARTHLSAVAHGRLVLVPVSEVVCLRADHKYTQVVWSGEPVLIEEPLKQLETELGDAFIRVHRSAIVRVSAIEALERNDAGQLVLALKGLNEPLPVARRLASGVRARLRL